MLSNNKGNIKSIKSKEEVLTYIAKLNYALESTSTLLQFQLDRFTDKERDKRHTNRFTIGELFPNENPSISIKQELLKLNINEYIETVKDLRFPKRSEFWVFGRLYNTGNVYIKLRVDIIERINVFVISFHYSTDDLKSLKFPYRK